MFFYLSKILWFFLQPSSLILALFVAGLLLVWRGRVKLGYRLLLAGAVSYGIAGLSPLGNALILPLEERFPRAELSTNAPPAGIIVLGGAIDTVVSKERSGTALNEAAERMTEGAALARRFPNARLVFSGGSGDLIYQGMTEAEAARRFYESQGIGMERILFESRSRNTSENASFTKELVNPRPGELWLLVTSAFHMPRSMGLFRKAGFDAAAWPADYRTRGWSDMGRFFPAPSEGLRRVDLAVKEWTGLFIYRLTGRIDALPPSPDRNAGRQ